MASYSCICVIKNTVFGRARMDDRSSAASRAEQAERRLADLVSQICGLLNAEDAVDYASSSSIEQVVRKVCGTLQCCVVLMVNQMGWSYTGAILLGDTVECMAVSMWVKVAVVGHLAFSVTFLFYLADALR